MYIEISSEGISLIYSATYKEQGEPRGNRK
jgi:hypothetical protein